MRLAGNGAGACGGDGDTTLAATRDGRGQRLTSGGCRDECAVRCMVQRTPTTFYAAISQERPPGGRSGAARRASRWVPGEGGTFAGLVPARLIPLQASSDLSRFPLPFSGDGDATLSATCDGRGQRLTSGGCRDECAEHFMEQGTPTTFYAARSQERSRGEVRRCPARFALGSGRRGDVRRSGSSKADPDLGRQTRATTDFTA